MNQKSTQKEATETKTSAKRPWIAPTCLVSQASGAQFSPTSGGDAIGCHS